MQKRILRIFFLDIISPILPFLSYNALRICFLTHLVYKRRIYVFQKCQGCIIFGTLKWNLSSLTTNCIHKSTLAKLLSTCFRFINVFNPCFSPTLLLRYMYSTVCCIVTAWPDPPLCELNPHINLRDQTTTPGERVLYSYNAGCIVHWYTGDWYTGTLLHWYTGTLATLVHWYTGILVHWNTGTLVHWYSGPQWYPGPLVQVHW